MTEPSFELGPIRPPSEALSLLLRLTRNCPWNRCEFCQTYKGTRFSIRSVEEVKRNIDAAHEMASTLKALSWKHGFGGEISTPFVNLLTQNPRENQEGFRQVALWLSGGGKNVFLQDADSLVCKTDHVIEILNYLKRTFPSVERITTYARGKTLSRKSVEDLRGLAQSGLSRIHIGLETGYDPLLALVQKGVTAQEQMVAGRAVKEAGLSLSEYVILGLGGKEMSREHAAETARVLNQIDPEFIRVRTLKVRQGMPLFDRVERGALTLQSDDEIVGEERRLIEHLSGIHSRFVSDHILNLLEEVTGTLPQDQEKMLAVIDRYLALPLDERNNFRLGRRAGAYRGLDDLARREIYEEVERTLRRIESEMPGGVDSVVSELMNSFL